MVEIPTVPVTEEPEEDVFQTLRVDRLVRHHALLLGALQDVADGVTPNLMVFMPPGSAKSTYADVVFVPWFMARKPKQSVILASYASDLARKQGRRARQLVKSKSFCQLFDARLSLESSAADQWALTNGSEYMAGGILAGLTGNRADLGLVDDPVKGREDADSETIRKKTREAYEDDFTTRLKPGGRQLIIQTRWHQDDLAGGILPKEWDGESGMIDGRDGRMWRVLCIPAIADRADDPLGRELGEPLWKEWFTPGHFEPFRRNARTWSSLFQQKPAPEEGTYFQKAWFDRYPAEDLPADLNLFGTSDYAVSEDKGDYTVHRVWGVDPDGDLWLLAGGYRAQATSDKWIEAVIDLMERHRPAAWLGEAGVIAKAVEPMLMRRMEERRVYCRIEWVASIHDKTTRARGIQARAAMGKVHLPEGPEGDAILQEYLRFPAGAHDDDVDVASLIGRALDMTHPAVSTPERRAAPAPRALNETTYDELHAMQPEENTRITL